MLTTLWSGLGSNTADRWAALLTSPALVFWLGGALARSWGQSGPTGPAAGWQEFGHAWSRDFGSLPAVAQAVVVVLALLLVIGSGRLAEALSLTVLRLLEGYWPRWASPTRTVLIRIRGKSIDGRAARWRELARRRAELSTPEYTEYTALNTARAAVPPDPRDRMPTGLGDVLKAAESRPRHRYGLDAAVCWPQLWLTLPEPARAEVGAARAQLDGSAQLWLWSMLFAVWTVFTWWAAGISLLGMAVAYRLAVSRARSYGRLLQACFDLYRKNLYESLGRDLPNDAAQEYEAGRRLTAFLERGPLTEQVPG